MTPSAGDTGWQPQEAMPVLPDEVVAAPPAPATVAQWLADRRITLQDLLDAGFVAHTVGGAVEYRCGYMHADGSTATRVLQGDGAWRWTGGPKAKGAVLPLGDAIQAAIVVIAEGESCGISAWRLVHAAGDVAVLCVPGSTMVGDDLANFISNGAHVVIATDADEAGDKCAAQVVKVLAAAGVDEAMIHRARPVVPGVEKPDLRDLVEYFEANASDPTTALDAWLRGWAEENTNGSHGASGAEAERHPPVPFGGGPGPAFPLAALPPVVDSSSWEPVDLLGGDAAAVEPELLRGSGGALVYPGLRHLISGPPETMKTWFALIMAAEVLADGGLVVWLNFDGMSTQQILERLRGLGVGDDTIAARFVFVSPSEAPRPGEVDAHAAREPRLAVLDSLEPAGALLGLDTNGSGDVERLMRELVNPFHRVGAATALLDHVTKDPETRGRYSIGSQRKLAAVNVHLGLKVIGQPLTRAGGQAVVEVTCHKDRTGALRRGPGGVVGQVVFNAEPGGGQIAWRVDVDVKGSDSGPFRPTALMERVSRNIEITGEQSLSAIERAKLGKAEYVRRAVQLLIEEGYLGIKKGLRGAHLHETIKPYRESEELTPSPPRPTPSPVPTP